MARCEPPKGRRSRTRGPALEPPAAGVDPGIPTRLESALRIMSFRPINKRVFPIDEQAPAVSLDPNAPKPVHRSVLLQRGPRVAPAM